MYSSSTFPDPPADGRKHHVQTKLNYFKRLAKEQEIPAIYPFNPEKHGEILTYTEPVEATVYDIAGEEEKYSLDVHGFQIHHHATKVDDFSKPETVRQEYFPEIEQMLKELTGAKYVFVIDPIVRRSQTGKGAPGQGPVPLVHIDKTPQDAVLGAKIDIGPEAEDLLKGRFQLLHVWRPLKQVFKDPFAVADAGSVPEDDLVHTKVVFPDREGSTYNVCRSPGHKFYYRYGQTPEMVLVFKSYDSKPDVARRNPHTAFVNPDTVDYPGRESVEVRAYVFYEPEQE